MNAIPQMFADLTARLEDLHAVAVDGKQGDNSPDMERVLLFQLRSGVVALDGALSAIAKVLDGSSR